MKNLLLLICVLLPMLLSAQEGAYLGVQALHMSNKKAKKLGFKENNGYYIARTVPDTPAEKAGFQPFDYIYAVNGKRLVGNTDLGDVLDEMAPGTLTTFSFIRDGKAEVVSVAVAERAHRSIPDRPAAQDPFLGIVLNHDDVPDDRTGVAVNITTCSTAKAMGLQDGDIIHKIDDRLMLDWNDVHYAIDDRNVGDPIKVSYFRQEQAYEVTQNIQSLAAMEACKEQEQGVQRLESTTEPIASPVAEVKMKNISQEEVEAMKEEEGIDMPIVNNLSITALQLFPNPTSGAFELRFELPNEGETSIRLFDASAKLVYQNQLGRFSGSFNERIDISNNARGYYFLEIRQDNWSISKKLILQ